MIHSYSGSSICCSSKYLSVSEFSPAVPRQFADTIYICWQTAAHFNALQNTLQYPRPCLRREQFQALDYHPAVSSAHHTSGCTCPSARHPDA